MEGDADKQIFDFDSGLGRLKDETLNFMKKYAIANTDFKRDKIIFVEIAQKIIIQI